MKTILTIVIKLQMFKQMPWMTYDFFTNVSINTSLSIFIKQLTKTRLLVLKRGSHLYKLKLGHCPWQSCYVNAYFYFFF